MPRRPTPKSWPPELSAEFSKLVPRGGIKLFVSHDHADAPIAEALVEFIQGGVDIPDSAIRCTSLPRFGLPNGADTEQQLLSELRDAPALIGLVTPSSRESDWVLFELGARWGAKAHLAPVLHPKCDFDVLPKPLRGRIAARLDDRARMLLLLDEVAEATGLAAHGRVRSDDAVNRLVAFAKSLPEPVGVPPTTPRMDRASVSRWICDLDCRLPDLVSRFEALGPPEEVIRDLLAQQEVVVRDVARTDGDLACHLVKQRLVDLVEQLAEPHRARLKHEFIHATATLLRRGVTKGPAYAGIYAHMSHVLARQIQAVYGVGYGSYEVVEAALLSLDKSLATPPDGDLVLLLEQGKIGSMPIPSLVTVGTVSRPSR